MALCHNCDSTRIEYTGDGSQKDYTFPFEYNEPGDVSVAFFNESSMIWARQNRNIWSFKNDTTIQFVDAPEDNQQLIIYRCTDLEPLPAEFFPGNSIKAQDLNDNFFVLASAIEEARCETERLDENNQNKYWNKISWRDPEDSDKQNIKGETIYATDKWSCADDKVATAEAICNKIEEEFDTRGVTQQDQRKGRWKHGEGGLDSDDYFATTSAISERSDPYFQSNLPNEPQYQVPGKPWFDDGEIRYRVWDQSNKVWIDASKSGKRGPMGPIGPHKTIVASKAPKRRDNNNPLEQGDLWFDSSSAQLYVYFDDGNPDDERGVQWVQAVSIGLKGDKGEDGSAGGLDSVIGGDNIRIDNKNSGNPEINAEGLVKTAGDTMTGQLTLPGGGGAKQALQKEEIEDLIAENGSGGDLTDYVKKAGSVMTGQLQLPGGGSNKEALQKQEIITEIDDRIEAIPSPDLTAYVEKSGSNMTGDLTLGTNKITLVASDGNVTATKFIGDGSLLTNLPNTGGGGGSNVEIGEDPPSNPTEGILWWSESDIDEGGGRLYVYTGDEWVDVSQPGAVGPKGDTGEKGDAGVSNTPGPAGTAATIAVGTTTTGNAGTNASVTNIGTASEAVFSFTIPKGDPGETATVNDGTLTIKDSAGATLGSFTANQAGNTEVIIPAGGGGGDLLPAGTRMLFASKLPPVGWSIDQSFQGHAMKIRSGDPDVTWVQSGGSVNFDGIFKSDREIIVNGTSENSSAPNGGESSGKSGSISVNSSSLSTGQLASHQHNVPSGKIKGAGGFQAGPDYNLQSQNTDNSGSGSGHDHGGSFSSHTHSVLSNNSTHAHDILFATTINMDVKYLNLCVGTKD